MEGVLETTRAKSKPHSIKDLADHSAQLMNILGNDPVALALAFSDMIETADMFFCITPSGAVYVAKGCDILLRLRQGQGLDQTIEMSALYVRDADEANLISQYYGDGTVIILPLGGGSLLS